MGKVIYFHINNKTKEIFYVGLGDYKRAYTKSSRSKSWHDIVNKDGYSVHIELENLPLDEAIEREIHYISLIGRKRLGEGTLINVTPGGQGHSTPHTDETRIKMSKSKKKMSEETRQKIGSFHKNKPWSEARRNAQIERQKNKN